MGFLPEEPKHFNSLREEFVHGLKKRLEEDEWKRWNDEHLKKNNPSDEIHSTYTNNMSTDGNALTEFGFPIPCYRMISCY